MTGASRACSAITSRWRRWSRGCGTQEGDGERREALAAFGETLRAHIRWEERDLFEALQETLSPSELDAAGREIEERLPKPTRAPWAEG